jgi:hypothetical protein
MPIYFSVLTTEKSAEKLKKVQFWTVKFSIWLQTCPQSAMQRQVTGRCPKFITSDKICL